MPEDPEEEHKTIFFRAFFQYRHRLEKFRPINERVSIRINNVEDLTKKVGYSFTCEHKHTWSKRTQDATDAVQREILQN